MAKVSEELIENLQSLSNKELVKIIVKFAKKYSEMNDILEFDYVKSQTEKELYEDLVENIEFEMSGIDGKIIQKELAKSIRICISDINNYKKVTKSKYREALALQYLLNKILEDYLKDFGTCWTVFDSKVATTAKRYFNAVLSLHEDYHIEFQDDFGKILKIIKHECRHFDSIFDLPNSFEEMKLQKTKKL
jgi:hypothetical protein